MIYYFVRFLSFIFQKNKKNKEQYISDRILIDELIENNLSLVRFGDGEASLMLLKSIYYQKSSFSLARRLLTTFYRNEEYMIKCIPKKTETRHFELLMLLVFFNSNKNWGDANIFREGSNMSNDVIERLWLKKKHVILVCSNYKYMSDFKKKYGKHQIVSQIQCRGADSYSQYYKLKDRISDTIFNSPVNKGDTIILLSSGPLSKLLAYDFSSTVQSIDLGHYFDFKFYDLIRNDKI